MLDLTATFGVNGLVWISSLSDRLERQSTDQILAFLEPFLVALRVPFLRFEPNSATELFTILQHIERQTTQGLRPIIHFDTHGGKGEGLYIAGSDEFVAWHDLEGRLRPINVASRNNLCVVSAACFSLHTIKNISIAHATPFFLLIAPERTVTFGFIESQTFQFYEELFTSGDVMLAYSRHLSQHLSVYLSERLLFVGMAKYLAPQCLGKGGRNRWRSVFKQAIETGSLPNTAQNRKNVREQTRTMIRPTQKLIEQYATRFFDRKTSYGGYCRVSEISAERTSPPKCSQAPENSRAARAPPSPACAAEVFAIPEASKVARKRRRRITLALIRPTYFA